MTFHPSTEHYSAREIARAAGVPEERVTQALGSLGKGETLVSHEEAVRIGRSLLASAPELPQVDSGRLFEVFSATSAPSAVNGLPLAVSGAVHALAVVIVVVLTSLGFGPAPAALADARAQPEPTRLVYLALPGPGGGGGGGGLRQKAPPPKAERQGAHELSSPLRSRHPLPEIVPVPNPPEPVPPPVQTEPLPAIVAPVASSPSDKQNRAGVLEEAQAADSRGPGTSGGVGTGSGTGVGEGHGAGLGEGSGGGTGGGPYRPGSGIDPPRLLSEVKPDYTDDARRRGIEGEVVMEIVVRRDGSVGDVKVLRGLAAGLNDRAVHAVRRWRFAPARLRGAPVDVVVEASVEFRMR